MKLPVLTSVLILATLPLLAQAPPQSNPDGGRGGRAGGAPAGGGGVDSGTTVNLGGGSNWRGNVPTGPVPRLPDGTVDLVGVWQGGGPSQNIALGLPKGETVPLLPETRKQLESRKETDDTEAFCLPAGVPRVPSSYPWRLVQFPTHKKATHIFMIFEGNIHSYRQIFMDGKHPDDPDPTWYGHSIGRWEGDTLVVDTVGFTPRSPLDGAGHPRTEQMHIIERWTRKDAGHMTNVITIEDPGAYSKPFTVTFEATLRVGDELMEYICSENNQIGVAGGYK